MSDKGTSTVISRAFAAAIGALLLSAAGAGAVELRILTTADGLPSNQVTALAVAPDGALWIGTGDAGAFALDPGTGKGRGYRAADGLSSDTVVSIAPFQGRIYVGTAAGLSVFDGRAWETIAKVEHVTMRNVRVAASPDGKELWACSVYLAGGTVRFDGKEWKFMGGEGRGLFNDVQGFAFLPEGVLMGDGSGAAYLRAGSDVRPLADGIPAANVFSVAAYREKWLVGTGKGLFEFEGRWKPFPLPGSVAGEPVFALEARGGRLVAGTANGLASSEGGTSKAMGAADGLPAARITSVAIGQGYLAAGTARGVALIRGW